MVEEFSTFSPPTLITMNLTKSFPPADDLVNQLQQVDYQKLYHDSKSFVINVAAIVAAIATVLFDKIQMIKFHTPDFISKYFYFGVNLTGELGEEIIGFSIYNRYVGLYSGSLNWGILDENGAL